MELLLAPRQPDERDDERDDVAEEDFLDGGYIARELDEERHEAEKERRKDNVQDALGLRRHFGDELTHVPDSFLQNGIFADSKLLLFYHK